MLKSLLFPIAFILMHCPLSAQDTLYFTLREAIDYAREHHPEIRQAQLEGQKGELRLEEMRSQALPRIEATGDLFYHFARPVELAPGELFDFPGADIPIRFGKALHGAAGLSVRQPLLVPGAAAGRESINKLREIGELQQRRAAETVALEVAKAYYRTVITAEKRALIDANLARIEGLLTLTERQQRSGFAQEIDVARLRVARENLLISRRTLELRLDQLRQVLKYRMGLPLDRPVALTDTLIEPPYELPEPDAPPLSYPGERPELALLRLRNELTRLDAERREAFAGTLELTGALQFNAWGDTPGEWVSTDYWYGNSFVGLRFSYPLFDGGERRARARQARLDIEIGQQELAFTEQSLRLQYLAARQELLVRYNELQSLRNTRDLARRVYDLTQRGYEEGVTPVMELLSAEAALREAQTNYLTALLEAKLAELEVTRAF